jgi:RNA polymerase sigma-70 factor (ECF subfamily)
MVRQIVERIRHKDQRAMSQLYQMYVEELSSVCYRYVPSDDDAKDVLQNSFVKIFTSIQTFDYRGEDSFKAWMKRVVVNEALACLKQRKNLMFVEQDIASQDVADDDEPQPERLSPDELHRLISELPDGYRTVVNLYVFEGYSHRQIAELLSISERTSASQLYHAKRLLAKRIKNLTKDKL